MVLVLISTPVKMYFFRLDGIRVFKICLIFVFRGSECAKSNYNKALIGSFSRIVIIFLTILGNRLL